MASSPRTIESCCLVETLTFDLFLAQLTHRCNYDIFLVISQCNFFLICSIHVKPVSNYGFAMEIIASHSKIL